jgi:glycosyltransferase involved in cell wall biosynthesis
MYGKLEEGNKIYMISIIMPIYNQDRYLSLAIRSILRQVYEDFELIIVNDGSTDSSYNIIEKYANKDKRIKIYSKDNGGTGSALNLGFSKAIGDYGTWVSGDNIYYNDMLSKLIGFLMSNINSEFVFSAFTETKNFKDLIEVDKNRGNRKRNRGNRLLFSKNRADMFFYNKSGIIENFVEKSHEYCMTGICYLYTMDLKRKCGDFIEIPGEDYLMGLKMGLRTKVGYIAELLGLYLNHSESVTSRVSKDTSLMRCPITNKTVIDLVKEINNTQSEQNL